MGFQLSASSLLSNFANFSGVREAEMFAVAAAEPPPTSDSHRWIYDAVPRR
jgi:hypothetical protein